MPSPHSSQAREADRIANLVCRRRLLNAALIAAAAWLTYVNPFTLEVRHESGWPWLFSVVGACALAAGYALWSVTAGDRRTWIRAYYAATPETAPSDSR